MSDELVPAPTQTPPAPSPSPPPRLAEPERSELAERARALVEGARRDPDDRQLARRLGALGQDAQRETGASMDLLRTKVGTLLTDLDGEGARIPKNLVALRRTMDSINPHTLAKQPKGWLSRLLRRTPVIGDVLADIAVRYESVQTQIDAIVGGLMGGKDELLQDSLELERLYENVRGHQAEVQKAAFMGEIVWSELEGQLAGVADPMEQQKLRTIVHRVAMRVQDLRTMEQVNNQFFASIDLTIQNNDHLSDAVTRTVTVARSLLTVGLAIQAALAKQKNVMKAVQQTQEYTSDMLAANAASIRQQTAEIGDLYTNPVLALDKVKSAFDDLVGAMDEMDRIRTAGTESARTGIAQLQGMNQEMSRRAEALREAREFEGTPDVPEAE